MSQSEALRVGNTGFVLSGYEAGHMCRYTPVRCTGKNGIYAEPSTGVFGCLQDSHVSQGQELHSSHKLGLGNTDMDAILLLSRCRVVDEVRSVRSGDEVEMPTKT